MGVKSTGSHPTTTKADGHLLEYLRSDMSVGGGAGGDNHLKDSQQLVELSLLTVMVDLSIKHMLLHHQVLLL